LGIYVHKIAQFYLVNSRKKCSKKSTDIIQFLHKSINQKLYVIFMRKLSDIGFFRTFFPRIYKVKLRFYERAFSNGIVFYKDTNFE